MSSFEDLGLAPEIVEALGAGGIEIPSSFQEDAVPVIRRGNNVIGRAGPGGGTLVAYGAPLLDRLTPGEGSPRGAVLAPTRERATWLARSLAELARTTGHAVAALEGPWALPEQADLLFATPADLLGAVEDSRVKLESLDALVVDGAQAIRELAGFEAVETLSEFVPADAQRVILSLPFPDELDPFVEGHVKRGVHIPPKRATDQGQEEGGIPSRGTLRYRVVEGDRFEASLRTVAFLLDGVARHVLVHFHSDDEAADVGDALTLHGYAVGAPGDASVPVWLGTDARKDRELMDGLEGADEVATLSYRVPMDPDTLDRRHARGVAGLTLLRGRELPHLEETARVAGYRLDAVADRAPAGLAQEIDDFRARIGRAVETENLASAFVLLEPLAERHGIGRVAAAAAALLRRLEGAASSDAERGRPSAGAPAVPEETGWVRLFMSLGHRDDAGPGDVLGAITGEARVDGSQVGRIDIRDTYSLVEVDRTVAKQVIDAVNGTTVKGRSIRVDFDRPRSGRRRRGGKGRE